MCILPIYILYRVCYNIDTVKERRHLKGAERKVIMKEIIVIKENLSDKEYRDVIRNIKSIINNEFKERINEGDNLNELFDFYSAELSHIAHKHPTKYFNSLVALYLDDDVLCDLIDAAPDWEFCEIYGLLDELADRADVDFDYDGDTWESDIDKAIEKLRSAVN